MRLTLKFVVASALALAGCTALLGTFEVAPSDGPLAAADASDAYLGPDATISTSDVPCLFVPTGVEVTPKTPCRFTTNDVPIPAVGACSDGKWECLELGGGKRQAICLNAVGPQAEVCTAGGATPVDENCDGTEDEGCACAPGSTRECGKGVCQATQSCGANGTWGTCPGAANAKPRDCASDKDNNCDGKVDRDEVGCRCDGIGTAPKVPVGGTRSCEESGGTNVCGTAEQTCQAAGDSARWSACPPKGQRNCALPAGDANCNGTPDGKELQCTCGDRKPLGTQEPCPGACSSINRTCTANTTGGAQWVGCPSPPITNCTDPENDANCNGIPDGLEKECSPCIDTNGASAIPVFAGKFEATKGGPDGLTYTPVVSGCAAARSFDPSGKACALSRPGFTSCGVCTAREWSFASNKYSGSISQDYWLKEALSADTSIAGCNLSTFSGPNQKCLYGRVCGGTTSSCQTTNCSLFSGTPFPTLGCGDKITPSVPPTAGTLCCCY